MTLGTGGRGPQARSVPQGPAVWLWRRRRFGSDSYSFLVGSEVTLGTGGRGPQARSVPQGPAVWLWRRRRFGSDSYSFLVGSESDVRLWRRRRFGSDSYSFLVGSESDVRHWGPWPAGPVCRFGVAEAPFVKLLAAGRQLRQLVFL